MSSENLLRLLTIFDISEEAEVLINSLRNSGFIVRDVRVEDDEDMDDPLAYNPKSKKSGDSNNYGNDEEECHYDMDEYTDEDKY